MLFYTITSRKSPKDGSVKHYPRHMSLSPVSMSTVIERISEKCTVTRADVKAVVAALEDTITSALLDGHAVRLSDLGSFNLRFCSKGKTDVSEVKVEDIKSVRVRFTPSTRIRRALSVKDHAVAISKFVPAKTKATPTPPSHP